MTTTTATTSGGPDPAHQQALDVLYRQQAAYREALAVLVGAIVDASAHFSEHVPVTVLARAIDAASSVLEQHQPTMPAPAMPEPAVGRDPDTGEWWQYASGIDAAAKAAAASDIMRPYRFAGGPWNGQTVERPRAFTGPDHCMPMGPVPGNGTWTAADAWPGLDRYTPERTDGDTVLMTWRLPTGAELESARRRREIRDDEKLQEYALDAAAEAREADAQAEHTA